MSGAQAAPAWSLVGPVLSVTVLGEPVGQGRISYRRGRGYHSNEAELMPWRGAVIAHARQAMARRRAQVRWPLLGPVALHATFTLRRRPSVRRATPTVRPDVDHLVRAAGDALTEAAVVVDDAAFVELLARKCYPAGGPGALDAPGVLLQVFTVAVGERR